MVGITQKLDATTAWKLMSLTTCCLEVYGEHYNLKKIHRARCQLDASVPLRPLRFKKLKLPNLFCIYFGYNTQKQFGWELRGISGMETRS
jgi:hypothetical protein